MRSASYSGRRLPRCAAISSSSITPSTYSLISAVTGVPRKRIASEWWYWMMIGHDRSRSSFRA
jgi:hypothetical protein